MVIAALIALGGGYYLYQKGGYQTAPGETPLTETPALSATPPAATGGKTYTVVMNASGFSPENIAIEAGDTVIFRNNDARTRWPASDLHPTHQLCLGFDVLKPMQPGEEYSHVFAEARDCPMHDHLIPSLRGKITVTE